MSKKFIAGILSIIISILCIFIIICTTVFADGIGIYSENYSLKKENFTVEKIHHFKDEEVKNLSIDELETCIEEQKTIQSISHDLANHARQLGWPEECETIKNAGIEWQNAQVVINFYQKIYDKKIEELKIERWKERSEEYPEATEIWLFMKDQGWNDYVCAGILGNIMVESGHKSFNIEPYAGKSHFGICQWNKRYSKVWGENLKGQCQFLKNTIKNEFDTFGSVYKKNFNYNSFLNLQDEKQAAKAFAKCYERCGSRSYNTRINCATTAYDYFTD